MNQAINLADDTSYYLQMYDVRIYNQTHTVCHNWYPQCLFSCHRQDRVMTHHGVLYMYARRYLHYLTKTHAEARTVVPAT